MKVVGCDLPPNVKSFAKNCLSEMFKIYSIPFEYNKKEIFMVGKP